MIKFDRVFSMPNHETFTIKPINELIKRYIHPGQYIVDPFARNSVFNDICFCNDLDPSFDTDCHMKALDFMKTIATGSSDLVFLDPPYSPRQISDCYKKLKHSVSITDTQSSFYSNVKNEIGRALKHGAISISFGWNSNGIGKKNGMEKIEILLVAHGGSHNDTIVTVEKKIY